MAPRTQPLDPRDKTIPQLLVERARRDPGHLAQRQKSHGIWQTITWANVLDHVHALADGLAELGLERGQPIAVIGENEPEHFFAEYAIQARGALSLSLYPDLTVDETRFILQHSGAVALFAQDQEQVDKALAVADDLPGLRHIIYWDEEGLWS